MSRACGLLAVKCVIGRFLRQSLRRILVSIREQGE
jgi:hypothetical protein